MAIVSMVCPNETLHQSSKKISLILPGKGIPCQPELIDFNILIWMLQQAVWLFGCSFILMLRLFCWQNNYNFVHGENICATYIIYTVDR